MFTMQIRTMIFTICGALIVSAVLAAVDGQIRLSGLEVKQLTTQDNISEIKTDIRSIKRYLLTNDKQHLE